MALGRHGVGKPKEAGVLEPEGAFWQLLHLVTSDMWEEECVSMESAGARLCRVGQVVGVDCLTLRP